jgi:hypothetical protein
MAGGKLAVDLYSLALAAQKVFEHIFKIPLAIKHG